MQETRLWTDQLRAGGTVTIAPRRKRTILALIGIMLISAVFGWLTIKHRNPENSEESVAFYLSLLVLLVWVPRGLWLLRKLVNPAVLTIDLRGIQLGSRQLAWDQVREITLLPRSPVLRYLAIGKPRVRICGDHGADCIDITHEHVAGLEDFAGMLRGYLRATVEVRRVR